MVEVPTINDFEICFCQKTYFVAITAKDRTTRKPLETFSNKQLLPSVDKQLTKTDAN